MRPLQTVKIHGHHTISFETLDRIEWHLANLDQGWKTVKEIKAKEHRKLHAKRMKQQRGKPVFFGRVIVGYERGKG